MRHTMGLIPSLFMLAGCLLLPRFGEARESPSQARAKVLTIGTDHAPTCFLSAPGYTNGHLRVVLNNFKPTMIDIESNPVWMARGIPKNQAL